MYETEKIIIGPTDGTGTVYDAVDVFNGYRNMDLVTWGLNVPGRPTPETELAIHAMIVDGTVQGAFGSLEKVHGPVYLQQSQVADYCRRHRGRIHALGYYSYFLIEIADKPYLLEVCFGKRGGLEVYVRRYMAVATPGKRWGRITARCGARFVVPM
jgi:hypothetical protein